MNPTGKLIVSLNIRFIFVLFALFFFGGEAVRGFSLGLIIGVLIGTYSSLYIVTTILISLNLSQEDMAVPDVEGAEFDDMP